MLHQYCSTSLAFRILIQVNLSHFHFLTTFFPFRYRLNQIFDPYYAISWYLDVLTFETILFPGLLECWPLQTSFAFCKLTTRAQLLKWRNWKNTNFQHGEVRFKFFFDLRWGNLTPNLFADVLNANDIKDLIYIHPDASLYDAIKMLIHNKIHRYF